MFLGLAQGWHWGSPKNNKKNNGAFSVPIGDLEESMLRRYGVLLAEAECKRNLQLEYLVPRNASPFITRDLRSARVQLYPDMLFSILEYQMQRYIANTDQDIAWRSYTFWLCNTIFKENKGRTLVFVDAPPVQRYSLYGSITSATLFIACTPEQLLCLRGGIVFVPHSTYMTLDDVVTAKSKTIDGKSMFSRFSVIVLDGLPQGSVLHQTRLLELLTDCTDPLLIYIGGESWCQDRVMTPWDCICNTDSGIPPPWPLTPPGITSLLSAPPLTSKDLSVDTIQIPKCTKDILIWFASSVLPGYPYGTPVFFWKRWERIRWLRSHQRPLLLQCATPVGVGDLVRHSTSGTRYTVASIEGTNQRYTVMLRAVVSGLSTLVSGEELRKWYVSDMFFDLEKYMGCHIMNPTPVLVVLGRRFHKDSSTLLTIESAYHCALHLSNHVVLIGSSTILDMVGKCATNVPPLRHLPTVWTDLMRSIITHSGRLA